MRSQLLAALAEGGLAIMRVLGAVTVVDTDSDGKHTYTVITPETYTFKLPCGCYIRFAVDAHRFRFCPVCGKRISHATI